MPKSRGRKPKSADKGKPLDHYRALVKLAMRQEGVNISGLTHSQISDAARRLKAFAERA